MNEPTNHPATPLSLEEGLEELLCNARQEIRSRYQKCENQIQKSPKSAVLGAALVGYLLHRMPVRAILVTQVRVFSALIPPALFLFGAAKLYEFLRKQECAGSES